MRALILCLLCLQFATVALSQSTYSQKTLKKIKEVENSISGNLVLNNEQPATIEQRMKECNVKGMSIAVIHNFKIDWAKGYGWANEASQIPVTTETLFEPGSISKTLNSLGILKLAQDKKIDLNTDINTYLTSWKFPYDSLSNGKKITLAHILSHTAGLTVHGFPGHEIWSPMPTIYQVLDGESPSFTPAVRSMYEPGLKYEYSGGGTSISQVLLTDVTGEAYDKWMYENVLKPIGMTHSTYAQPPTAEFAKYCASAYHSDGSELKYNYHVYPEQAAAGLWMTPSDLCQYIIDMQLAYKGGKSKVLNEEMVKLHLTPLNDGPTALGTFIQNHDGAIYFEHGAGNDGFCGQFYGSLEDGNGVVIFLNNEDPKIIPDVINSVAKAYKWKNFYQEPRRKNTIQVADDVIEKYQGIYLYDNTWSAIAREGDTFKFHTAEQSVDMHFITPTLFINREFQAEKEIQLDANGYSTGYTRQVNGKKFPNATKVNDASTLVLDQQLFLEISWYLFSTQQYQEAIAYYHRAIELNPQNLNLQMNLAHSYLYNGDYQSALAIHRKYLNEYIDSNLSWKDSLEGDFKYLSNHHFDTSRFAALFFDLGLKKPEGY